MVWLWVGLGGAIGSIARHGLNHVIHQRNLSATFPWGIFAINVMGSAAIGVIAGALSAERWNLTYNARVFVIVGVLGGFTTFSSFTLDTLTLLREGHADQAFYNVAGQVLLSLFCAWAGYRIAYGS